MNRLSLVLCFVVVAVLVITYGSNFLVTAEGEKKVLLQSGVEPADKEKRAKVGSERTRTNVGKTEETLVLPMQYYGVSEPLSDLARQNLPSVSSGNGMVQEDEMEKLFEEPASVRNESVRPATIQTEPAAPLGAVPGTSFEGPGLGMTGFTVAGAPPDTTLAVGPNHIVAWVNTQYAVFDKSGNKLLPGNGFVDGNTLFTGLGNVCETTNRGDPILQYDRLADRWILSQFAFNVTGITPSAPYLQCIAVSTTNSPLGSYFRYTISFSSVAPSGLNDYGKLGVWPDAYYTSYNIFQGSPAGANSGVALCASDRTKMLAGDGTATTLCAPIDFYGGGAAFLPADLDGTTLPTDTTQGGIFMRQSTALELRILKLKPDFVASTVTLTDGFGGALGSFISIPIGATTRACNGTGGTCVAQPGTANLLDTLGDRLMYRLAYRNRGGVDSLVVTQSVDPDGAGARSSALRWYEIRSPFSATPTLLQNATFDPGGAGDRWMGSIAMDQFGNMLMGYSVVNAGTSLKPSIAVAGRLLSDSVNTMQTESTVITGTGSQTGTLHRWGDYTTMQIDPSDDATFWFIGQYLAADGTFNWHTRIASYKFTAANVYTWNQTGSAAWTTATNWTPTRTTPAVNDILVFNNGATTTATAVPTETIGQLVVLSNTNVTLQAGATATLTIAGDTGTDLSVAAGSQLNVNTATALTINVATGATGSIGGSMTLSAGAHRLTAVDASGITFNSGATFTEGTSFSGNPFGTTNLNSVVLANGSTFVFIAGSNPFGAAQPSSCVVFQTGSLYSHQGSATPAFSGRTYANFELNIAATTITVTGGSAVAMDNLTVTAGTLNFNMTATPGHSIKGNISVAGTLNFNPASAGTVNLNGSGTQTISGAGTLTINAANQTVVINNSNGVSISRDVTLNNGTLTFTSGNVTTGANTLSIGSTETVNRTSGHVIGNLRKTYAATGSKTFEVGTANGYSPVTVNATAGTFNADFTVKATQGPQPNVSAGTSIQRYWTLTGTNLTADITFQYNAGDVMGTEANYKVIRISGGTSVSFPSSTVNTGAHTATLNGASSFSDWTVGQVTAPTAAPARISGQITTQNGAPLAGVTVQLNGARSATTITNSSGDYRFDNVDTESFYTVTPSLANYHFAPASRSFSLVADKTDAIFTASPDATASANAIDSNEYFVRQQYLDFLGREPDQGGFNYWSDQLNQCNGDAACTRQRRIDVSAAFFASQEFQETGSFVYRLYQGALGRQLSYSEFSADRSQVVGGPNLGASKTTFANAFGARAEFIQKYQANTSAESFVDALLQTLRDSASVDLASERGNLIGKYNSGGTMNESRALVLRDLGNNAAFSVAVYNPSFVLMEYFGYLQRGPDQGGYDFWLNALNNREPGNYRGMVCAFITSSEYQRRFGPVVTRTNAECGR
jgi:hypothetical protein